MYWDLPPKIKIYEALGSLGDGRLEVTDNKGKLYSSSRNKFYEIEYDPETNSIMCNDNASYFVGYLGYPAIAFLMAKKVIEYDKKLEAAFEGIRWKDINTKYKNDFKKTKEYALLVAEDRGFNRREMEAETENIFEQIKTLNLKHLGKKKKPPQGY